MRLLRTPFFNLSHLILVLVPGRFAPPAAGLMFGFYSIAVALALAMASELVPRDQTGRWIGVISLVRVPVTLSLPETLTAHREGRRTQRPG